MATPIVSVTENTSLTEIARLLNKHRIKRVPVVKGGDLVGIVSRADLLRAMAVAEPVESGSLRSSPEGHFLTDMLKIFVGSHPAASDAVPPVNGRAPVSAPSSLTAETFRHLVKDFHRDEVKQREMERQAAASRRQKSAEHLIDTHVTDELWQTLLQQSRKAAAAGRTEMLLLRFPSTLCFDEGRAINVGGHDWPATLRGEPAELYLRWERDLKGRGFHVSARVLEFPDGKPGDVGLFLVWGDLA